MVQALICEEIVFAVYSQGIGQVKVKSACVDIELHEVLFEPDSQKHLLSVKNKISKDHLGNFEDTKECVKNKQGVFYSGIYFVQENANFSSEKTNF